jgi:hypothetical protein
MFKWKQRRFRAQSGLTAGCINGDGYRQIKFDDKIYAKAPLEEPEFAGTNARRSG